MYKYNPKSKIKEPIKIEFNSKNLLLFCNPNGMIYQLFTPDKFLPFLEGGCDILLWNYRGYGGSSGYPTFKNAKTDALELFDYAKKKYINYNKFGVYGYSV
jgi:pimeloyl-ACP methyl ester carboxylesterase